MSDASAPRIKFSSRSKSPYNLLSNFHGDVELHYMADRFENAELRNLLTTTFSQCNVEEFRKYFKALHPGGKPETYITRMNGKEIIARGILGRLAGTAVIKKSAIAKRRMKLLKEWAGVEGEVKANTERILRENGGRWEAIDEYNERLMRKCLKRKFGEGMQCEDIVFRDLLKGTEGGLMEVGRGKWCGRGEENGLLGEMLMQLREEIKREDEQKGEQKREDNKGEDQTK